MLSTCQYLHPANGQYQPTLFLHFLLVKDRHSQLSYFRFYFFQGIRFVKKGLFFWPFPNTCKIDTYFQKNQNDAI